MVFRRFFIHSFHGVCFDFAFDCLVGAMDQRGSQPQYPGMNGRFRGMIACFMKESIYLW
jgi:hypothetical protein